MADMRNIKADVKIVVLPLSDHLVVREAEMQDVRARDRAHSGKTDGVDLSGQSMFMLLIWRIPPLLTGEMMRD